MKIQKSYFTFFCFLIVIIFAFCGILLAKINRLEKELMLVRITMPGRSKREVISWLGQPNKTQYNIEIKDKKFDQIMIYNSNVPYTEKINGAEDIWIVLNKKEQVIQIYYPDYKQEKSLLGVGEFGK